MTIQKIYVRKEYFTIKSRQISKEKEEKDTYPMDSLGERSLESNVTCSSKESTKDKLETLVLGIHYTIQLQYNCKFI